MEEAFKMKNDPQKLIAIFEAMADGVCIVNQDFIVEYMNSVMLENFSGDMAIYITRTRFSVCWRRKRGIIALLQDFLPRK